MTSYCRITGLKLFHKPEWINRKVSDSFEISFWTIGDFVIYSRPRGKADIEGAQKAFAIKEGVKHHFTGGHGKYIQILDFEDLKGSTLAARSYFIQNANNDDRLSTMIFCNLSAPWSIAVKIGNRFNTSNKIIHIEQNYKHAINRAMKIARLKPPALHVPGLDTNQLFNTQSVSFRPIDLILSDDWKVETPNFCNHSVVINNNILHSTTTGYLESNHVPQIDEFRNQCLLDLPDGCNLDYIVVNGGELTGSSRSARLSFMKSLSEWHSRHPFKMYLIYNANTFTKTAFHIARPLMPFKVKIVESLGHALQVIHDYENTPPKSRGAGKDKTDYAISKKEIDNLLGSIGGLNWEVKGFDSGFGIPREHPFYFIYQSVGLIKEELDELFEERERLEQCLMRARKLEAIGTLAGGIAHDFNNILAPLLGYAEILKDDLPDDENLHKSIDEIINASLRAKDLVRKILLFRGQGDQQVKSVRVQGIIQETIGLLKSSIPSTIEIFTEVDPHCGMIYADPTQIHQVIMNLSTNAYHAMQDSGGTLSLSLKQEKIKTSDMETKDGDYAVLTVSDTGIGIEKKILDKIFDPYFTTKDIGKGTGLGLSVVQGIIEKYNGTIDVFSEPGKGTTVKILLPTLKKDPNEGEGKAVLPIQRGSDRILLIDDEQDVVNFEIKMFEKMGYLITAYTQSVEALKAFKKNPEAFDLVFSDMTMPKMTGIQLAHEIKSIRKDIPFIICTGFSEQVSGKNIEKFGIDAYIAKPVVMNEISQLIRDVLNKQHKPDSV